MIRPYLKPNACKIAMSETIDRFLEPCGHTYCHTCLDKLTQTDSICPCCRKTFTKQQIKTLYL